MQWEFSNFIIVFIKYDSFIRNVLLLSSKLLRVCSLPLPIFHILSHWGGVRGEEEVGEDSTHPTSDFLWSNFIQPKIKQSMQQSDKIMRKALLKKWKLFSWNQNMQIDNGE